MTTYKARDVSVEALTWDELVKHGLDSGANAHAGMPWSFEWMGHSITHENDDCYLVPRVAGIGDLKIGRDDVVLDIGGCAHVLPRESFDAIFAPAVLSRIRPPIQCQQPGRSD